MATKEPEGSARRFALIALLVFVAFSATTAGLRILGRSIPVLQEIPTIPVAVVIFSWAIPLLIAYKVEKRDARSLGLTIRRENYVRYALYAVIGLVVPAILTGVDIDLIAELADQVVYIGLPEEAFSRGYIMTRLCGWLGDRKGLFFTALLFGLSHITSRISQHGFDYPLATARAGLIAFLGGLLLGYIYLRSRSIVPGAIVHISGNAYMDRLIERLMGLV